MRFLPQTLLALSVIKRINHHPTYLNIIAPLFGLVDLLRARTLPLVLLPLALMIGANLVPTIIFNQSLGGLARLLQLAGLVGFAGFLLRNGKTFPFVPLMSVVEWLSLLIFLVEIFYLGPAFSRMLGTWSLPRYQGIIGEPNFSAHLYLGFFIIHLHRANYPRAGLNFGFILLTLCRSALVAVPIILLFYCACRFAPRLLQVTKMAASCFLLIFLAFPLLLSILHQQLPISGQKILDASTSYRYSLQLRHLHDGLQKFWGSGHFQHDLRFLPSQLPPSIVEIQADPRQEGDIQEQHNLALQVLTDFGLIGYLLFSVFLLLMATFLWAIPGGFLYCAWNVLVFAFLSLNGLGEFIFYFFCSYALAQSPAPLAMCSLHRWRKKSVGN